MQFSCLQPYKEYQSTCSYCNSGAQERIAYGTQSFQLTVDDYDNLLNRGWLRSGSFLYLPTNSKTCCPNLAIRLPSRQFDVSSSHRRVLKRWAAYLAGRTTAGSEPSPDPDTSTKMADADVPAPPPPPSAPRRRRSSSLPTTSSLPPITSEHRALVQGLVHGGLQECIRLGTLPAMPLDPTTITVSRPKVDSGNVNVVCTNVAFRISKHADMSPAAVAGHLIAGMGPKLRADGSVVTQVTVGGPGYMNFTLLMRPSSGSMHDTSSATPPHPYHDAGNGVHTLAAGSPPYSVPQYIHDVTTGRIPAPAAGADGALPQPDFPPVFRSVGARSRLCTPTPHTLTVELVAPTCFDEAAELYTRFNVEVHGAQVADVGRTAFTRHLVESPLMTESVDGSHIADKQWCHFPAVHPEFDAPLTADERMVDDTPECRLLIATSMSKLGYTMVHDAWIGMVITACAGRTVRYAVNWFATHIMTVNWIQGAREHQAVARESRFATPPPADPRPPQSPLTQFFDNYCNANVPNPRAYDGRDLHLGLGTFHALFRIDGELVAVSVLDVLPTRVASVYCFYNPELRHLELGKLTALWELYFAQHAEAYLPSCQYYDMNFYVHQCARMNYKRFYQPSEVLCPYTRVWVPLVDALPLLDANKHSQLYFGDDVDDILAEDTAMQHYVSDAARHCLIRCGRADYVQFQNIRQSIQASMFPYLSQFLQLGGFEMAFRLVVDPGLILQLARQAAAPAPAPAAATPAAAPAAATEGEAAAAGRPAAGAPDTDEDDNDDDDDDDGDGAEEGGSSATSRARAAHGHDSKSDAPSVGVANKHRATSNSSDGSVYDSDGSASATSRSQKRDRAGEVRTVTATAAATSVEDSDSRRRAELPRRVSE